MQRSTMQQAAPANMMQNVGFTAPLRLYAQTGCKRELRNLGVVPADIWEAVPPPQNPASAVDVWHSLQSSFMATPIPVDAQMDELPQSHNTENWNAVHDFFAQQLKDLSTRPCRAALGPAVVRCEPYTLGAVLQAENEMLDNMCNRNGPQASCR